jgi:hypothetical protein
MRKTEKKGSSKWCVHLQIPSVALGPALHLLALAQYTREDLLALSGKLTQSDKEEINERGRHRRNNNSREREETIEKASKTFSLKSLNPCSFSGRIPSIFEV